MRLQFDMDDEDAFETTRDELLGRFEAWPHRGDADPDGAGLLLDWKYRYGDGDLATWTVADLREFLLDWCPRKVSLPPDDAPGLVTDVRSFLQFMAAEQLIGRGSSALAALDKALVQSEKPFVEAMGDHSKFGMGKSIFAGLGDLGIDVDIDDPASLQAAMDRFNSLSYEERGRVLGLPSKPFDPWEALTRGIELPPAPRRLGTEAEAAMASHPLTTDIETIRAFLGTGRKLTAKGNLKVADAVELSGQLGSDANRFEWAERGRPFTVTSADDLPGLQFRLRLARACGATKVAKGVLSPTATWRKLDRAGAVTKVVTTLAAKGPLQLRTAGNRWAQVALNQVLDEGVPHLLAVLWAMGSEPVEFDDLAEAAGAVCVGMLRWGPHATEDTARMMTAHAFDHLMDILEEAGVVARSGGEAVTNPYGRTEREGGELTLTPLARAVLAGLLRDAGYAIPEVGELADGPLAAVLERVGDWHVDRVRAEFDAWVDAHGAQAAVDEMVALSGSLPDAQARVAAMSLVEQLPEPEVEQVARRLLDTPLRGHALAVLAARGHDVPEGDPALLGAVVDALASHADDDEEFAALVAEISEPVGFIDRAWRITDPAAGDVLAAIGRLHPDPAVAKHARKAVIRHRSHLANLRS